MWGQARRWRSGGHIGSRPNRRGGAPRSWTTFNGPFSGIVLWDGTVLCGRQKLRLRSDKEKQCELHILSKVCGMEKCMCIFYLGWQRRWYFRSHGWSGVTAVGTDTHEHIVMIYSHTAKQDTVTQKKDARTNDTVSLDSGNAYRETIRRRKRPYTTSKTVKNYNRQARNGHVDTRHTNIVLNMLKSNLPNPKQNILNFLEFTLSILQTDGKQKCFCMSCAHRQLIKQTKTNVWSNSMTETQIRINTQHTQIIQYSRFL